jgi:hypothetical protein
MCNCLLCAEDHFCRGGAGMRKCKVQLLTRRFEGACFILEDTFKEKIHNEANSNPPPPPQGNE